MTDVASWVLNVTGLTKRYGLGCPRCAESTGPDHGSSQCPFCQTVHACVNAGFTLYQGEVLGIVGESGSGKSTLMQLINLTINPTVGEIWYREPTQDSTAMNLVTMDGFTRRHFRNDRLGIVHQRPELGLNMRFSVGGNVAEKLLLANWRHIGRIRERITELMIQTELPPERIDDDPNTFSGGMLQRVQIAKALSSNPGLLL
ncbi:MAG: ATP-binding cassette domain-containing protein, partial [Chloroflexi bacterium]